MLVVGQHRRSRVETCLGAAGVFGLSREAATALVAGQLEAMRDRWEEIAEEAEMTVADRSYLAGRQILNRYAFEGLTGSVGRLADAVRAELRAG